MRQRLLLLFVPAFVLGLGGVAFFSLRGEREPEYNGWKLSQWLEACAGRSPKEYPPGYSVAAEAVQHMGTNALPFLIKWIQYQPSPWAARARTLIRKLPASAQTSSLVKSVLVDKAKDRAEGAAAYGFRFIGLGAARAAPELIELMNDPRRPAIAVRAVHALSAIGQEGLLPLLTCVTNRALPVTTRQLAAVRASTMMDFGANAAPALPLLISFLRDNEPGVAGFAAQCLGHPRLAADVAVPALTDAVRDLRPNVRQAAAMALGEFGQQARSAVPALLSASNDQDASIRMAVWTALRNIDPRALEKSGEQKNDSARQAP